VFSQVSFRSNSIISVGAYTALDFGYFGDPLAIVYPVFSVHALAAVVLLEQSTII
jgi:hypothetical protein